ncbi:DUF2637 domain-containing protein [Streptomyces sp. NBC_01142]|uniref:DUF2637 domain-containing protein n=1 Tax=Streptomyces sp. NBC_01142 TaxID=2975865 RepID=UPI00225347C5|nr:DUF2637 domain-containing protein [Streptomyces sp. NBC_01142]MCX4826437.1 DUF2637 domain-containing protein [Streptomyces sp. NBC_01142]
MVGGAVVIAGIGFVGSYAAVRDLAIRKGFGTFAHVFPLGVDAGILVLLALDLLLTWLRMPFPMLRQTAWLLTGATISFNGAAAWPDPLGVGMHAVIPILFVVTVEAARHTVGQLANITAGRHMEPVRLIRWLLSPLPTFKLWRRMKLWELRSYDTVIKLEQERLVYQARLRSRFGRAWRRKAPVEARLPLQLARYGVPLSAGRDLVSASPQTPEGNALETHVADALAITSAGDDLPEVPTGESMNVPPQPVNAGAAGGVNPRDGKGPTQRRANVHAAAEREPGTVNPDVGPSVNPPIHAPADALVNGSRQGGSRPPVNRSASEADSRMKQFTATVNGIAVNRVNSVNPLLTGTVNGFTPIVKPREFTREAETVNRPDWSVKPPVQVPVNRSSDRESDGVNDAPDTVKSAPDKAVNEHPDDRKEESVNDGEDGVNAGAVNSRRTRRLHAAKAPAPSSVHAAVGAPSPEEAERAKAAADWFAAKKANPSLTQKAFVEGLGRSPGWMTKALKEAARKAEAAADD